MSQKALKYMQCGMKTNKQKEDSMLFIGIAYIAITLLAIGIAIGRLL